MTKPNALPAKPLRQTIPRFTVLSHLFENLYKLKIEERAGFNLTEFCIIDAVGQAEGKIIANNIVNYWFFEKMTTSRAIKNLELADIITRKRHPKDGRRYNLYLTAKGRRTFARLSQYKEEMIADIQHPFSSEESKNLEKAIHVLIEHMWGMLQEEQTHQDDGF